MNRILLLIVCFLFVITARAQVNYTWNGSVSTDWNTPANWTPNGVPGNSDDVNIGSTINICKTGSDVTVRNFQLSGGKLDLNGNSITISGTLATFSSGVVQNGTLAVPNATTATFGSSGGNVTMNCKVILVSESVTTRNTTFQQSVSLTKTGSTDNRSNGDNIFNGPAVITNAGSGYFLLANATGDQFNNTSVFNNTGSGNLYVAYNGSKNVFGGTATFNNTGSSNAMTYISFYASGTSFNNNIIVNSTSGAGVQIGGVATSSTSLSAGKTISTGTAGFTTGTLLLKQFTQQGSTPQVIALSGDAVMNFQNAVFNGRLTVTAPNIYSSETIYNDITEFTKTDGAVSNANAGGNTFNATFIVNYNSSNGNGYFSFGNGKADTYNGDVYSNNNSLDRIIFGHGSSNNQFNGNLVITQTGAATGTALTWNETSGSVIAAGKTISIGSNGFSSGYLYLQGLLKKGNTPINITTTGTSSVYLGAGATNNPSEINGNISVTSPDIYVRGCTFNNDVILTKTGGISNHNNGHQNIFNAPVTINQQSNTGYFMLGYNSNDIFNADITVSSTGSGGINLGYVSGSGGVTLGAGSSVLVGPPGFNAGFLRLGGLNQSGNDPINLTLTGSAVFYVSSAGAPSTFTGTLTVVAPDIYIQGGVFNAAATFTKTGGSNNHNSGIQNIFNGPLAINQKSNSGYFMLGYNSNDLFNDDISISSSGSGGIFLGYSNGIGNPTLSAGKAIKIGPGGFSDGFIQLINFTQLGNAPSHLLLTGTNSYIAFGKNTVLGGNMTVVSPGIFFNGATFNGTVDATKTGPKGEYGQGGNTFNKKCTISNTGDGYLFLGNLEPDIWNDDVTFTNSGSERLSSCWNSTGNQFNGNIYLNSSGASKGISFGGGSNGTATLAATKTISAGTSGLNAGYVILKQFTQLGSAPITLSMNNTATFLQFGPNSMIGGDLTTSSPGLLFNGCTFNGTVNSEKTGASNDGSAGNNYFNKKTTLTNSGTGYLLLGNGGADVFNADATFNNIGKAHFYVAYNSSNNIFNGDVTFNNSPTANSGIYASWLSAGTIFKGNIIVSSTNGNGVQFCGGNTTASAVMAAGKTISVGSSGFSSGILLLRQFTQQSSTDQNFNLSGTANLTFGPSSSFAGNVTSVSPSVLLNGCTFSGSLKVTRTGAMNDPSWGGNTFNGMSTFINNGTGYLMMTRDAADVYNNDVVFVKTNSGQVFPNYNNTSNYAGNIRVSSTTPLTFGANGGTAILSGTGTQNINGTSGEPAIIFSSLIVKNSGGGVILNSASVNISKNLVLTSGILNTTTANILTMLNGATVAAGDTRSASYVNGPMNYQKASTGFSILNFPIGNNGDCRPVVLAVNHSNNAVYTYQARLFNESARALGYTLPSTVNRVSDIHYYKITRSDASGIEQPAAGLSGEQSIQIFFDQNDVVSDLYTLTIVKNTYNNPTSWIDIGGAPGPGYGGGPHLAGSVMSTSTVSIFNSFSTFALANNVGGYNVLPTQVTNFSGRVEGSQVGLSWMTQSESNNDFFTLEKSADGIHFQFMEKINSHAVNGNSNAVLRYSAIDLNPYAGTNYYRLKQTSLDGSEKYENIVRLNVGTNPGISIFPNPTAGSIFINGLDISVKQVKIQWYDLSGRALERSTVPVQNGIAPVKTSLGNGLYLVKYSTEDGRTYEARILIKR